MSKRDKYNPDYEKLYSGEDLTPALLNVLKQSDRKMKYMEVELKRGAFRHDASTQTAVFVPSREDSLERLWEDEQMDFTSTAPSPEEEAVHNDELDRLRKALKRLEPEERELITALFFEDQTERQYAESLGISQKAVNKRWHKIRSKLKKLINF